MSLKEFLEKCCWQNRTCGFCDEVEQVKMYFEIDEEEVKKRIKDK